jgi:hypothetical protein
MTSRSEKIKQDKNSTANKISPVDASDSVKFIEAAKTRQWAREKFVRPLA